MAYKIFSGIKAHLVLLVILFTVSTPTHAMLIGNVSGTFDNTYLNSTPTDTDAINFLAPLLGGSFQGSYILPSLPTPGNWPSLSSWEFSFFDSSTNLISTISSSDPGYISSFHDSNVDYLLFYNSLGVDPYLQLAYPDNFVGNGNNVSPSFLAWYNGSTGAFFGEIEIIAGSSAISPIPVPAAVWLFGTALIGLVGFSNRRKTS